MHSCLVKANISSSCGAAHTLPKMKSCHGLIPRSSKAVFNLDTTDDLDHKRVDESRSKNWLFPCFINGVFADSGLERLQSGELCIT